MNSKIGWTESVSSYLSTGRIGARENHRYAWYKELDVNFRVAEQKISREGTE